MRFFVSLPASQSRRQGTPTRRIQRKSTDTSKAVWGRHCVDLARLVTTGEQAKACVEADLTLRMLGANVMARLLGLLSVELAQSCQVFLKQSLVVQVQLLSPLQAGTG